MLLNPRQVSAATPSPTASPKASPASQISSSPSPTASLSPAQTTQNLKDRIEKIVEEKRDQIEGVLDELSGRKRGFIGEVLRVSSETITLRTNKGPQILSVTPTLSITKAGNKIPLDDIAVGDWAIAIGSVKEDEFQPERLVISSTPLWPQRQVITIGTIDSMTKTTITIAPRVGTDKRDFIFTKSTSYQDMNGDTIRATQVNPEQAALVVGVGGEKGDEARVIRLLSPVVTPTPTPRTNAR